MEPLMYWPLLPITPPPRTLFFVFTDIRTKVIIEQKTNRGIIGERRRGTGKQGSNQVGHGTVESISRFFGKYSTSRKRIPKNSSDIPNQR